MWKSEKREKIGVVATTNGAEVPRGAINLTLFCVYACVAFWENEFPFFYVDVCYMKQKISQKVKTVEHSTNSLQNETICSWDMFRDHEIMSTKTMTFSSRRI